LHDVRTFRGADVASDHHLVVAKIRLRLKKMSAKKSVRPLSVEKLKDKTISDEFCIDVSKRFAMLQHAADFADFAYSEGFMGFKPPLNLQHILNCGYPRKF